MNASRGPFLLLLAAGLCLAAPLQAQPLHPGSPSHAELPHRDEDNLPATERARLFQERLKREYGLQMAQEVLKDPKKFGLDDLLTKHPELKKLMGQGLENDPRTKLLLEGMIERFGQNPSQAEKSLSPELRESLRKFVESFSGTDRFEPSGSGTPAPGVERRRHSSPGSPPWARPPEPPPPPPQGGVAGGLPEVDARTQEQRAKWARRFVDAATWVQQHAPPSLRNSPALQEAFRDLDRFGLGDRDALAQLEGLAGGMEGWLQKPGWMPRLDQLRPPVNWSLPDVFRDISLPRVEWSAPEMPAVGTPQLPGPVSAPGADGLTALAWVVLAVVLGFCVWKLAGLYGSPAARAARQGWKLGPWPVHPSRVRTRAELVQAFEYLSLLRLGVEAQSWNHCMIAEGLADRMPRQREAVAELAAAYEQARYAPEREPIPDEVLAAARRDLCLLAGVSAA